jgi:1,4-dihydroxy-2-naphthoate octaprenyltransferase
MRLKAWFLETRPQFLTLSVVLAFLGTTIAWYYGFFSIWRALLAGFGLVITHASVNIINDYFDYKSGIDLVTKRTPFSGGSGILPSGMLTPKQALWLGIGALIIAIPIGIYFTIICGWELLPLLILAAFFIILYSPFILKRPWPEWAAGVGLGAFPILGLYFVQSGAYTWQAVVSAIPSFFLVHNLLLLNEFPDTEADVKANRKTLPLTIGKKNAGLFFMVTAIAVYVWIFAWAMARVLPSWTLIALLTFPLTLKAISGAIHNDNPGKLMPGMAMNVMTVLVTQILLGIGFILGRIF